MRGHQLVEVEALQGGERFAEEVVEVAPLVRSHVANEDYTDALCALAGLRAAVDQFFEDVMVMAEEPLCSYEPGSFTWSDAGPALAEVR